MNILTQQGNQLIHQLAEKYQLSTDTVKAMLLAVREGNGNMAQFNIPELGGMGQWMQGGMTMVGDMFNNNLKFTVEQLCNELSQALQTQVLFSTQHADRSTNTSKTIWWPSDWGYPDSQGSQNLSEYAYFPKINRLAVRTHHKVVIYDTQEHQISGFSQQQPEGTLLFSSQNGTFPVASLPVVQY